LSWHLAYGLMTLGFAAEAPVGSTGNVQRRVRTLTRQDLLIAISFGQCLRDTVEAALRAKKLGVPTLGSPTAKYRRSPVFATTAPLLPSPAPPSEDLRRPSEPAWNDFDCLRAYPDSALAGIASPK